MMKSGIDETINKLNKQVIRTFIHEYSSSMTE